MGKSPVTLITPAFTVMAMRVTLELSRDREGRLVGTVTSDDAAGGETLSFSGILQLVERLEAALSEPASS
jgi:hypothetical protein